MRLQTLFCTLAILSGAFLISCDKNDDNEPETEKTPTNFAEISLAHIKAVETAMHSNPITVSDGNNIYWEAGDIFVYRTGEGRYGKFEVQKIDPAANYKLTIQITNYAADGSVFLATNSVEIRGTYLCDLDIVTETSGTATDDFHWNRLTSTNTMFDPKNGAKFVKYQFKS
ncbi:MAG: hypothetical protein ACK5JD_05820 [Mangrovibacterium sp.]